MNQIPNTARLNWVLRCVHRLRRVATTTTLPSGLFVTWEQYTRLVRHIVAEYREE